MKRLKFFCAFLFLFSGALIFTFPTPTHALPATGGAATNVIGQYVGDDGVTDTYTETGANDNTNMYGFDGPSDVEIDTVNHRMFISERFNNRVLVFNLDASNILVDKTPDFVLGQTDFISKATSTTAHSFSIARGMSFDQTRGYLFVSDSGNNRVLVFDVNTVATNEDAVFVLGQADFVSALSVTTQASLKTPGNLMYDQGSNRLFVADGGNNRVLIFDMTVITDGENAINVLGQPDFVTNTAATTASKMSNPQSVVYDAVGQRLFVGETGNARVINFDLSTVTDGEAALNVLGQGNLVTAFGSNSISTVSQPQDLEYIPGTQTLVVSSAGGNFVKFFDVAVMTNFEAPTAAFGSPYLYNATTSSTTAMTTRVADGLKYDSVNQRLYVAQGFFNTFYSAHRVSVFDVSTITTAEDAIDIIGQYDDNDGVVANFTKAGPNGGAKNIGLHIPIATDFDYVHHRMFVVDQINQRILVHNLDSDNELIDEIPDAVLGQSDFESSKVSVSQHNLSTPNDVVYDSVSNYLYVSDGGASRVIVYDVASITNGEPAINVLGQVDFFSNAGVVTQAGMITPRALALDTVGRRLFVANINRIQVFDVTSITDGEAAVNVLGQADFTTATGATTAAGLNTPFGMSYDVARNYLYVSQTLNRVSVFDVAAITDGEPAINVLGQAIFTTNTAAVTQTGLSGPRDIDYDETNKFLYVAQLTPNRVSVFDLNTITDGEPAIAVIGQSTFTGSVAGSGTSNFYQSQGVGYNEDTHDLYVSDSVNNRLLVFPIGEHVIDVTSTTTNGTYAAAATIYVSVQFSGVVNVTGTPELTLETGTTDRVATYISGSGTDTITFEYTVQVGDVSADLDYVASTSLALAGGTILDAIGAVADLSLPDPSTAGSLGTNKAIVIGNPPITIEFSVASAASTDESAADNTPTLFVNGTLAGAETVEVAQTGGTATAGSDYTFTSPLVVTIPAGVYDGTAGTAVTFIFPVITDDTTDESNETIILTLQNPSAGLTLGDADSSTVTETTHTYTITDDDTSSSGGSSGRSSSRRQVSVALMAPVIPNQSTMNLLGGEEPNVPPEFSDYVCTRYLRSFITVSGDNPREEVIKLQQFLNEFEGEKLELDGVYDALDIAAVNRFQTKYKDQILAPWGLTEPTNNALRTTVAKINIMMCSTQQGCPYFPGYAKKGDQSLDVVRIQDFINIIFAPTSGYPTKGLLLSKTFDQATFDGIVDFQNTYREVVLKPWGITQGTGWWYKTTNFTANKLMGCTPDPVQLENGTMVNW